MFDYLSPSDQKSALDLAKRVATGRWRLFTGAGVSKPSKVPDANDLIEAIGEELGLTPKAFSNNLAAACTRYERTDGKNRDGLITLLKKSLDTTGLSPSSLHDALINLTQLNHVEIYTTNVEDMWEKALAVRRIDSKTIIDGLDFASLDDQQVLVKLHGDLSRPDSLIFSEWDYREYPKDETIAEHLRTDLVLNTFFFVGYAGNDENLRTEIQVVFNRLLSKTRDHFLITHRMDDWRRNDLSSHNIHVISLGTYSKLDEFLHELLEVVESFLPSKPPSAPMSGLRGTMQPLTDATLIQLFMSRYEPVRLAINSWELDQVDEPLKELLKQASELDLANPSFRDFYQRLLLAAANVDYWCGRLDEARATLDKALSIGPLSQERAEQAGPLAANLGDTSVLAQILTVRANPKLDATLKYQQGQRSEALSILAGVPNDTDVRLLKARILLDQLDENTVPEIVDLLEAAWKEAGDLPVGLLQVANVSEMLLRRIVDSELSASGLNRRLYIALMRIPGQVIHPFRSKSSTDSVSSHPVIPIEVIHRFRREAIQFSGSPGISGWIGGIVNLKGR